MFPFTSFENQMVQYEKQNAQLIPVPVIVSIQPSLQIIGMNVNNMCAQCQPGLENKNLSESWEQSLKIKEKLIENMINCKSKAKKNNEKILDLMIKESDKSKSSNPENDSTKKKSRIPFTKQEDEKLKYLVRNFGTKNWKAIAFFMNKRTAKQCRDRYSNYLFPGYFQGEWTKKEDDLLMKLYNEFGSKWSVLQTYFPNRSSNSIKNRWFYFLSKNQQSGIDDDKMVNDVISNNIENPKMEFNEFEMPKDMQDNRNNWISANNSELALNQRGNDLKVNCDNLNEEGKNAFDFDLEDNEINCKSLLDDELFFYNKNDY